MLWWVLLRCFLLLQPQELSSHEELWGESTVAQVKDWQAAREAARVAGLEAVLRELWSQRAAPSLFMGIPADEVDRIQKIVMSKKSSFLIGLSGIQENRSATGAYTFRALYQIDVAGFLREIKRLLLFSKLRTVHVYLESTEPAWAAADWSSQLSQPGLSCVVKTEKLPEHCPVDFCIQAQSRRSAEGWEALIRLRTTTRIEAPKPRRGPRPKPTEKSADESFSTVATVQQGLYLQLPPALLSRLGVTPTVAVQIQSPGTLDFAAWMQVLFLIQRQEPEIVALRTIGLLSGRNTAVFHVRQAPGGRDMWFKGLYLGKNVTATWKKRADGVIELQVETPKTLPESRPQ
ncbi:MAG: hypothetical protein CVU59_00020 [Deltaproteobacteria bacterium HGW-Deltaproteobacteria-17]|nr:MAG: hypothetical protein CVU59_00020 [Deltaproteobacteria bacterium HGW-Deltaproteobacteria-17]